MPASLAYVMFLRACNYLFQCALIWWLGKQTGKIGKALEMCGTHYQMLLLACRSVYCTCLQCSSAEPQYGWRKVLTIFAFTQKMRCRLQQNDNSLW